MSIEDLCFWEVQYKNGTYARESEGNSYFDIDRENLSCFRLIYESQIIFETWPSNGDGRNLIYRRRRSISSDGSKMTIFIVGWLFTGPIFAVNLSAGVYRKEKDFIVGDPEFYPPELMLPEKNMFLLYNC